LVIDPIDTADAGAGVGLLLLSPPLLLHAVMPMTATSAVASMRLKIPINLPCIIVISSLLRGILNGPVCFLLSSWVLSFILVIWWIPSRHQMLTQ
jgi:hypothetical protein